MRGPSKVTPLAAATPQTRTFVLCVVSPDPQPRDQAPSSTRLGSRFGERVSESSPPPPTGTDPQVRRRSRSPEAWPAGSPRRLRPGPQLSRPWASLQAGAPALPAPFRPPRPIVPDLTHLRGCRRRPGWGARGQFPAAQKAGSVTARSTKANSTTSPPALWGGSRRGRFTLLARQRRPRRLLRPLWRKALITNGRQGAGAETKTHFPAPERQNTAPARVTHAR